MAQVLGINIRNLRAVGRILPKKIVEALITNKTLTSLILNVRLPRNICHLHPHIYSAQDNKIGDEGAEKIAEALAVNSTLTNLSLHVSKGE